MPRLKMTLKPENEKKKTETGKEKTNSRENLKVCPESIFCTKSRRMSSQSAVWQNGKEKYGKRGGRGMVPAERYRVPSCWDVTAAVQLHVYAGQAYAVSEAAPSA